MEEYLRSLSHWMTIAFIFFLLPTRKTVHKIETLKTVTLIEKVNPVIILSLIMNTFYNYNKT